MVFFGILFYLGDLMLHARAVNRVPVQFHADAGLLRDVRDTVFINRIFVLHRKPERLFRHEQFEVFTVLDRATDVQVRDVH